MSGPQSYSRNVVSSLAMLKREQKLQTMNRIGKKFTELKQRGETALIPFITAGDPDLDITLEIMKALAEAGADCIELGIPFSDPLADGLVNQLAAQRALEAGTTVPGVLEACWTALRPGGRLVVNAVTVESEAVVLRWHGDAGGDLTRIAVDRAAPVGGFTGWRPLMPVTQWAVTKPWPP